ncbi:MAG TPA: bifunctional N(6)-L-threonylcarbamoyladenine synthase/serine/threonine protein kinase [Candidatus Lokiarchaeia archaeon]|nr:bifunctional N(6)-L-threonylcarbamoyladenine synthase/serine/threonine protein kinase [Candidatus Lokiarchaeia archaeon]
MEDLSAKFCLGIESTAHTFGAGIVNFRGDVLAVVNDTFVPDQGGLHPREVAEHHAQNFPNVLRRALEDANLAWSDLNLIAFSQGPGLGPCLRVGATVARALHFTLKLPLVGVNHCIAHVEIGRLACNVDDPLTLYVSGGNTIVSAFEEGRYRIFGETLDLAVGNMIDMFARAVDLPHPGGPKVEKLASESSHFIPLPYVVKGMDLSFSGLLTAAKNALEAGEALPDVAFSLQEVAFAMLTEVTERALAHTKKGDVLLTGGVAANRRLQEMIEWIAGNQAANFHVVPLQLAGDNGAMIAWAGVEQFLATGPMDVSKTAINPKVRMDEVPIPWRAAAQ